MDFESDAAALQAHQSLARNYVKFYLKWIRNNFLSKQEGREMGEHRDYVMVICPGQPKSEVHRQVQEVDKKQYPQEWLAYQEGREHRISGTPVEMLPGLEAGRADALKAIYIHSIEQLASASEPAKRAIGIGANELVNRAKACLSRGNHAADELRARLEQKERETTELRAMIEKLSAQVEALGARQRAPRRKAVSSAVLSGVAQ